LRKLKDSGVLEVWLLEDLELMIEGLLEAGHLIEDGKTKPTEGSEPAVRKLYRLTAIGQAFVDRFA
jgi:hypothetical protein